MSKRNRILIAVASAVVIISVIVVMFINNNNYNNFSLSIFEKKWLNDHQNELVDWYVVNDVPVLGNEGSGVAFDFINNLKKNIELDFNVMPYSYLNDKDVKGYAFRVLNPSEKITDEQLLFFQDNYVLISKKTARVSDLRDLNNIKIGMLKKDLTLLTSYINNPTISYNGYDQAGDVVNNLKNNSVDYIILPNNLYIANILSIDDYYVNYNFNDISLKYVLQVDLTNKDLTAIIKKYYYYWHKKYINNSIKKSRLATFYKTAGISSEEQDDFNGQVYTYGYVNELPYADKVNNEHIGLINTYVADFSRFANVTFKYKRYTNINAINKDNDLDLMFKYDDSPLKSNQKITSSIMNNQYLALSHESNAKVIDNVKSLDNETVYVMANTYVEKYLKQNTKAKLVRVNNISSLLKTKNEKSIIVMDEYLYRYTKNNQLQDMDIKYKFNISRLSGFILNGQKNSLMQKLFNFYLLGINTDQYNNQSVYYLISNPMKQSIYDTIAKYIIVLIIVICVGLIFGYNLLQKKKVVAKVQKDEKLKYIDQMTSLKNRNYLNDNIGLWDENNIYPQAVMVVDLNNIKYINDNHGHEAGDEVIKKAASILINNQKENSDIIRIDGNEFLIYMIGYQENEIVSYMRKIYKELKTLPHEFGGAVGYSMIEDDIKTLDDAINEATLDMRVNKETSQRS